MKKILLLTLLLAFSSFLMGKNSKLITINFNYEDFQIENIDGLLYVTSTKQLVTYDEDASSPALPWVGINILIGVNDDLLDFSYIKEEELVMSDVVLAPNPTPVPTNVVDDASTTLESVNYTKTVYPREVVKNCTTHIMDGYKFISLCISPFRYDATNGKLYFIDKIQLTLNIDPSNMVKRSPNRKIAGNNMRDIVKRLIVNTEDFDVLYGNKWRYPGEVSTKNSQSDYEYLIVTRDSLKSAFQALANWKMTKGIRSKVLTIEEIDQNYTGASQPLRIKKALNDYYNGTYNGLKYVLLGGDNNVIPSPLCYIEYTNYGVIPSQTISDTTPTDMYYACLAKMDWNSNGNSYWGEVSDSVSLGQDVFVTRLLVGNRQDVENITKRIILYEKGVNATNGNNSLLMCGSQLAVTFTDNGQIVSDAQLYGDILYSNFISPYWNGTRIRLYDTYTDFYGGANYSLDRSHLQIELSKGYPVVFMGAHGLKTAWELETDFYNATDASVLENQYSLNNDQVGTTHIITSSCLTNAFDYTYPCLSYTFMKNPNSGVLSYTGCSRNGLYFRGSHNLGASDQYCGQLFKLLYTDNKKNYGALVAEMKTHFIPECGVYNPKRWVQFGINPIGDPEMPIFVNPPINMNNVVVTYQNGNLNINANTDSCMICVTSKEDCGTTFFEVTTDVSYVSIPLPVNTYNICITKPGYSPYLMTFSNDSYIQDETFDGMTRIVSNNVNIGRNVTTLKPEGPVVINSGETSVSTSNNVTIKNDFEVKLGATFFVKTGN